MDRRVVLLLLNVYLTSAFIIRLKGGRKNQECFREYIDGRAIHAEILFRFEVAEQRPARVQCTLTSPSKKVLFETKTNTQGVFTERVYESGDYEVCFYGMQKASQNSRRHAIVEFDFKVKQYGTHLALLDAMATTSVSLSSPDTSNWEDGMIPLDSDSRMVFLRFDLSKLQDYSALYGDRWNANLRIFIKGMMPHIQAAPIPRCILSHYYQLKPPKEKLKAADFLFNKKADTSEWNWAPYEITWMSKPTGGQEIVRESCMSNAFIEFSVTDVVTKVLNEPTSRRQLTLSLQTEEHMVFMVTAQQKQIELFPIILFQLEDGELIQGLSEFEKSIFMTRTDLTHMQYQLDSNHESNRPYFTTCLNLTFYFCVAASWTVPRIIITRIMVWCAAAVMSFVQFEYIRSIFERDVPIRAQPTRRSSAGGISIKSM